jgi:hypothetical protein
VVLERRSPLSSSGPVLYTVSLGDTVPAFGAYYARPCAPRPRGRSPVPVRRLPRYYGKAQLLLSLDHWLRPYSLPDAGRRADGKTVLAARAPHDSGPRGSIRAYTRYSLCFPAHPFDTAARANLT